MKSSTYDALIKAVTFPSHFVSPADKTIAAILGRSSNYAFASRNSYYDIVRKIAESGDRQNSIFHIQKQFDVPSNAVDLISKSYNHQYNINHNLSTIANNHARLNTIFSASDALTSAFYKTIASSIANRSWENWNELADQLEEVEEITESIVSDGYTEELREKLLTRIFIFCEYIQNSKAYKIGRGAVAILSFMLLMNEVFSAVFDLSPQEVVQAVEKKIDDGLAPVTHGIKSMNEKLDQIVGFFSTKRYCDHSCYLRQRPNTKGNCLGIVKENQMVIVIDQNKKWLCIGYIDDETREPKSGWVFKKYFSSVSQ